MKFEIENESIETFLTVDEEELYQAMGLKIDKDGNIYDPLSKDMDLDGVADRYDADFRDSKVQSIGDLDKREKSSVIEKLKEYKTMVEQPESKEEGLQCCKEVR